MPNLESPYLIPLRLGVFCIYTLMQNYEAMILEHFTGTPKEKYEQLLALQLENATQKGTIEFVKTFFQAMKDTPDNATLGNLRTILDAHHETLLRS